MKKIFIAGFLLVLAFQVFAVVVDVPRLSDVYYVDGEKTRNVDFVFRS